MKYATFYKDIIENGLVLGKPVSGFFELTSRCNLRCKMCYICGIEDPGSLIERELTTAQWIKMGEQARDAGVLFLTLTGGEIFMRKDFLQIYEAFTQMGFIITLYTNATLLTDTIIKRLAEIPPLRISITLYGASASTYGKITEHPEAYEKTVTNIKKIKAAGIDVHLKTTVIKYNSNEFDKMARIARSMGLGLSLVNYVAPRREGTGTDPLGTRLDPIELAHYEVDANSSYKLLNAEFESNGVAAAKDLELDDVMLDENFKSEIPRADLSLVEKTAFSCAAGKCTFWVTWDGKMLPCGLLGEIHSDALNIGFEEAFIDIKNKCREVPSCQICESCSYHSSCQICPARLKLETGSYTKPAEYFCKYIRARDEIRTSL